MPPTWTPPTVTPGAITSGLRAASGAATPRLTAAMNKKASRRFTPGKWYGTKRRNRLISASALGLLHPIPGEIEPEREPRVAPVAAEAALDLAVRRLAPAVDSSVLGPRPRVQ